MERRSVAHSCVQKDDRQRHGAGGHIRKMEEGQVRSSILCQRSEGPATDKSQDCVVTKSPRVLQPGSTDKVRVGGEEVGGSDRTREMVPERHLEVVKVSVAWYGKGGLQKPTAEDFKGQEVKRRELSSWTDNGDVGDATTMGKRLGIPF